MDFFLHNNKKNRKARERELATFDENRRAVGMLTSTYYIYARWKKWRHEPAFSAPLLSTRLDHLELENKLYCVRYGIYLLKWGAKSRASVSQGEKGRHLCDYVFCPEEDRWGVNLVRVKLESNSNTGKRAWKVKEITFKKKQRVREYNIIYLSRFKRGVPR